MPTRTATPDDLAAIAEIYAHYVRTSVATFELDPPDTAEWRRRFDAIAESGLPFVVTERDGSLAGYAYCAPWKTRPAYASTVEDSVYVSPAVAGQGCGTELLRELLVACGSAGVREVIAVIADTGDPASVALHHRFGFTDAGRLTRVGYKHGRFVDTFLLQHSLA
ncbi:GNAT family N-acetyltransferase [Mycolicibacterium hodleri]|uniref:N-acetyltransferase family protein n=1 Tax=Mycolicibacterium hodleri TaxID=49897 RepID=A0A502E4V9_9MYCO|nr:GNAT family N-acetyltransferase [Mycolicibacterium hodleri]TPG31470.1 N-acetyltransferase family protein [Mycolicibacterium hodleri]